MFKDMKLIPKILFHPVKFFSQIREQSIGELYKFWIQLSVIGFILALSISLIGVPISQSILKLLGRGDIFSIYSQFLPENLKFLANPYIGTIFLQIVMFLFNISIGFVLTVLGSLFIHVLAYLFGCRGFNKTLTASIIASTPTFVVAPIPIIGRLAGIYFLVLVVIGIWKLHKISIGKAILIIVIPVIILGLIVAGLLFATTFFYSRNVDNILTRTSKTISVLDASCIDNVITLVVSNDGTTEIDSSDITILVNNIEADFVFDPSVIGVHSAGITTVNGDSGNNEVLISSPSNEIRQIAYC